MKILIIIAFAMLCFKVIVFLLEKYLNKPIGGESVYCAEKNCTEKALFSETTCRKHLRWTQEKLALHPTLIRQGVKAGDIVAEIY